MLMSAQAIMMVEEAEYKGPRAHHVAHAVGCSLADREFASGADTGMFVPVRLPAGICHHADYAQFEWEALDASCRVSPTRTRTG